MTTNVVMRVDRAVSASNHNQRVGIQFEREIISRLRDFARMPGKQPAAAPDPFQVQLVNRFVSVELPGQGPSRPALRPQSDTQAPAASRCGGDGGTSGL